MMSIRKKFTPAPLLDPAEFAIERIDRQPRYAEAMAELQKYENRLAETRARRDRLSARLNQRRGAAAAPTMTADQLIAGEREPGYSEEGELGACEIEETTLRERIAALVQKIAEIRGELSFEMCMRFREENAACHRAMFDAMTALDDAMKAVTGLTARLQAAGYEINATALPRFTPWAAYQGLNHYIHGLGPLRAFVEEKLS